MFIVYDIYTYMYTWYIYMYSLYTNMYIYIVHVQVDTGGIWEKEGETYVTLGM